MEATYGERRPVQTTTPSAVTEDVDYLRLGILSKDFVIWRTRYRVVVLDCEIVYVETVVVANNSFRITVKSWPWKLFQWKIQYQDMFRNSSGCTASLGWVGNSQKQHGQIQPFKKTILRDGSSVILSQFSLENLVSGHVLKLIWMYSISGLGWEQPEARWTKFSLSKRRSWDVGALWYYLSDQLHRDLKTLATKRNLEFYRTTWEKTTLLKQKTQDQTVLTLVLHRDSNCDSVNRSVEWSKMKHLT